MKRIVTLAIIAMLAVEAFGWGGVGHRVIVEIAAQSY